MFQPHRSISEDDRPPRGSNNGEASAYLSRGTGSRDFGGVGDERASRNGEGEEGGKRDERAEGVGFCGDTGKEGFVELVRSRKEWNENERREKKEKEKEDRSIDPKEKKSRKTEKQNSLFPLPK